MNRIIEKMYDGEGILANKWVGKSESYRDAARIAKRYGQEDMSKFFLGRMRFWSLSAAEQLRKIK